MSDDAAPTEVMTTAPSLAGPSERPRTSAVHDGAVIAERYALLGLLGSGGMGTVYRARDLELDEIIALKVLKRDLARSSRDLEGFRREVKLARKVTHRNVVRTFDIGSDGADRFISMQYVEGTSLSELLGGGAYLPSDRVVALAIEVCEGLLASHEAGVVHGDLKPQNVIVMEGGRPVITDFGLARAVAERDDDRIENSQGTVAGTPAYMAPEQVEGLRDLDARADIYALGCMLFRAVTGILPWKGPSGVATAVARLVSPPVDARVVRAGVKAPLAELILRCMARQRSERFASIAEVHEALSAMTPRGPRTLAPLPIAPKEASAQRSVAIIPIHSDGTDGAAYLARAVGDHLLELLGAVPTLRVIAVVARAAGATASESAARDAGYSLGVDIVVVGELSREDESMKVTLRAITVEHGFRLWAYSCSAPVADVLRRTHDAATSLAASLGAGRAKIAAGASPDAEALDLYLRGRHLYATAFFDIEAAIPLLKKAHELAPVDARIGSMYALALMRHHMLFGSTSSGADEARRIADEILEREPGHGAPHIVRALLHYDHGEHRSAALEMRRAYDLDANNADLLSLMGNLLLEAGQPGRAVEVLRAAATLDPALETVDATLARAYELVGDSDSADELLGGSRAPSRDIDRVWIMRARFALWREDAEAAARLLELLRSSPPLSKTAQSRVERLLSVARDGSNSTARVEELPALPRRAALMNQVDIEMLVAAGKLAAAEERLANLAMFPFFDLTWLDGCRLLAPLRATPTFAMLRRATAARVAHALEVLDA